MSNEQGRRIDDKRSQESVDWSEVREVLSSHPMPAQAAATEQAKLLQALRWALEWIDAVPSDTVLPAMPGFDRDYVNLLIGRAIPLATPADAGAGEQPELPRLDNEEIDAIWQTMPGGPANWLKGFGYQQFAKAIEDEVLLNVEREVLARLSAPGSLTAEQMTDLFHAIAVKNGIETISVNGKKEDDGKLCLTLAELFHALSAPGAPVTANKDVEWLMQCAKEAQSHPEVATKIRAHCMAASKREVGQSPAPVTAEPAVGIDMLPELPAALEIDWPQLHRQGLGCGVEDRGIHDRYEAAEYGWQVGMDDAAERVPELIYDEETLKQYALDSIRAFIATHSAPADRDAIRDQAPEEAAKVAEDAEVATMLVRGQTWDDGVLTQQNIAKEIRALKTQPVAAAAGEDARDAARYRWLRKLGFGLPKLSTELDAEIDDAIVAMSPPSPVESAKQGGSDA